MNPPAISLPPARSWRDLPQPIKPRAMSREGRRRRVLAAAKTALLAATLLVTGWGGAEFLVTLKTNPGRLVAPAGGTPVRGLELRTDGVLDEGWARGTLALPAQAGLMTLDLAALQRRLLASGQVERAELTRQLPGSLVVTLHERAPVARVMGQLGEAVPQTLLVARDGTVFAGAGYAPEMVARLPFLDGVRLQLAGSRLAPIAGMAAVADLLAAARAATPALAHGFSVVSLARLATDDVLVVQSADVGEVVFGAAGGFARQLARLDFTLAETRRQFPVEPLRVNLAVDSRQVLVARLLAGTPAPGRAVLPRPAAGSVATPVLFFPAPPASANFSHAL